MNLSLILLKTGRPEESLKECLKLLDHLDDKHVKRYAVLFTIKLPGHILC